MIRTRTAPQAHKHYPHRTALWSQIPIRTAPPVRVPANIDVRFSPRRALFALIHLASCHGAFEVEQQLLHNTGPALTKEHLCESGGVEQPLHNTWLLHTKEQMQVPIMENTPYITLSSSSKKKKKKREQSTEGLTSPLPRKFEHPTVLCCLYMYMNTNACMHILCLW